MPCPHVTRIVTAVIDQEPILRSCRYLSRSASCKQLIDGYRQAVRPSIASNQYGALGACLRMSRGAVCERLSRRRLVRPQTGTYETIGFVVHHTFDDRLMLYMELNNGPSFRQARRMNLTEFTGSRDVPKGHTCYKVSQSECRKRTIC
jgi:hypothetical protein